MSLKQFSELEHVGVVALNTGHGEVDGLLERAGIKRRMRLVVPHFIAIGPILHSTDLIATVPQRFAVRCEVPFGLTTSPPRSSCPTSPSTCFGMPSTTRIRATCGYVSCRSEEHTSELQSLMRISYAVFRLITKKQHHRIHSSTQQTH